MKKIEELSIDTTTINNTLQELYTTTQQHSTILSKVSHLEKSQCDIQRKVNQLDLTLSSRQCYEIAVPNTGTVGSTQQEKEEEDVDIDENDESKNDTPSSHTISSFGTEIQPLQTNDDISITSRRRVHAVTIGISKMTQELEHTTTQELKRMVIGLKAIITQIQNEHDVEMVQSVQIRQRLDSIRKDVVSMMEQMGIVGNASKRLEMLMNWKDKISRKVDEIPIILNEFRDDHTVKIESVMNSKMVELQSLVRDVEESFERRQAIIDSRMGTLSKASDVAALSELTENEFRNITSRLDQLDKSVVLNEKTIFELKQERAINTIISTYEQWKKNLLREAWIEWLNHNRLKKEAMNRFLDQQRFTRKMLLKQWFRWKQNAWAKWRAYNEWHQKEEARMKFVTHQIDSKLQQMNYKATLLAFHQWHRVTITKKIHSQHEVCAQTHDKYRKSCSNGITQNDCQKKGELYGYSLSDDIDGSTTVDLVDVLNTFKKDRGGAMHTLAQEINNIRSYDLSILRKDVQFCNDLILMHTDESLSREIQRMDIKAKETEEMLSNRLDDMEEELPVMKKENSQLRGSLYGTINRVKNIEKGHGERIEFLFQDRESTNENVGRIENELRDIQMKVKTIEHAKAQDEDTINALHKNLNEIQSGHEEYRVSLNQEMNELKEHYSYLINRLNESEHQQSQLNDMLITTKNELIQTKISTDSKFEQIQKFLDAYGVHKPKIDRLIQHGIMYEEEAKDKTYVYPMNSVSIDEGGQVNIVGDIASFSYSYATWIAYTADHEAISILVEGMNPDEAVVEDEIGMRRKDLVQSLRAEMETDLSRVHPDPGALRLEARTRFLNRVISAVDTALSKYETVCVPSSTTFGRVRVGQTVCLACDRPFKEKKVRRSGQLEEEKLSNKENTAVKQEKTPQRNQTDSSDTKHFVVRGGFKMPI